MSGLGLRVCEEDTFGFKVTPAIFLAGIPGKDFLGFLAPVTPPAMVCLPGFRVQVIERGAYV